jgi:hypothetical protein
MGNTGRLVRPLIRAVRIAAQDRRIPRPLRWLAAFGLLPIPGPFDEAVLLIVAVPLALFYRRPLVEAWQAARTDQETSLRTTAHRTAKMEEKPRR